MATATETKPTREELKALKKANRLIDRKRWHGTPLTAEDVEVEIKYARLYCQARANEEDVSWYLTRNRADGTVWGVCDRDLEIKATWGLPLPEILETFTRNRTGAWKCPGLGAV